MLLYKRLWLFRIVRAFVIGIVLAFLLSEGLEQLFWWYVGE